MSDDGLTIDLFIPLTDAECEERDRLDAVMNKSEEGFTDYVEALNTYKQKRLFRDKYETFEKYFQERRKKAGISRQRRNQLAHQLIVLDSLASQPGVDILPENERQIRELAKLTNPAEQAAAWLAAQAASGEEQPASGWVKSGVEIINQAKEIGAVDTGDGKESPPTAGNVTEAALTAQDERIRRMRDHIKANRKSKPVAVLPGKVTGKGESAMHPCISIELEALPDDIWQKLSTGETFRFVIYAIPQVSS